MCWFRASWKIAEACSKLFGSDIKYHVNPTGKFVIGGPHGDTGLTGRKNHCWYLRWQRRTVAVRSPEKILQSWPFCCVCKRHIAKNLVAAGLCDEVLVQVTSARLVLRNPLVCTWTRTAQQSKPYRWWDCEQSEKLFDMRPYLLKALQIKNPYLFWNCCLRTHGPWIESGWEGVQQRQTKRNKSKSWAVSMGKLDYVDQVRKNVQDLILHIFTNKSPALTGLLFKNNTSTTENFLHSLIDSWKSNDFVSFH